MARFENLGYPNETAHNFANVYSLSTFLEKKG